MALAHITAQLERLIQDLYFPSETDARWQVVVWPVDGPELTELTEATLRQYLGQPAAAPVASQSLADLAAQVQRRCRGYGGGGKGDRCSAPAVVSVSRRAAPGGAGVSSG